MTNPKFMKELACSQELGDLIGKKKVSRPQLMKDIWVYIKKNNLQNPSNKREILPDVKLGVIIGDQPLSMFHLAGALGKHLTEITGE